MLTLWHLAKKTRFERTKADWEELQKSDEEPTDPLNWMWSKPGGFQKDPYEIRNPKINETNEQNRNFVEKLNGGFVGQKAIEKNPRRTEPVVG